MDPIQWVVSSNVNRGRYDIASNKRYTAPEKDRVIAGGLGLHEGTWFLRHFPQQGENCYMYAVEMTVP